MRRTGRRRSVLAQTLFFDTLLICASVVCVAGLFLLTLQASFRRQLVLRAETVADFVARESVYALSVGDRAGLERIAATALAGEDVLYVVIASANGEAPVQVHQTAQVPSRAAGGRVLNVSRAISAPVTRGVVEWEETKAAGRSLGTVQVGFSAERQQVLFTRALVFGLATAALALLAALGCQYFHLRRMFRPLAGLIEFTRRVAKGDLTQEAPIPRLDEFGDLALAFNQMVHQLNLGRQEMSGLLQEAQQASRLKSEFLANMSHEIRTPMNGVLGMTTLALTTPLNPEQREYLELARSSAESLLALLNQILDFSRIEAGRMDLHPEPFSLRGHLESVVKEFGIAAGQKGLELNFQVASGTPERLVGDPVRLRQVLFNLVGNAIKFTDQGYIRIRVEQESETGQGPHLHFSVADTGIGVAPDKQGVIFEAFRQADGSATRRYGGTGLGLAIASRLVQLMGGRIWLESQPGAGSTFHFTAAFERPAASVPAPPAEAPRPPESVRKLRILLAEDNPINRKLATRLLEKRGHEVAVAANGREALAVLQGQSFDVVLMDVQMPEMDGLEAASRIREDEKATGARIPIVAMTAHALKGDREKCLAAGMDGYVSKPVRAAELFAAVESAALDHVE